MSAIPYQHNRVMTSSSENHDEALAVALADITLEGATLVSSNHTEYMSGQKVTLLIYTPAPWIKTAPPRS